MSFKGIILKEGQSTTGVHYSKDVLLELIERFNKKYEFTPPIGQISTVYPPVSLDPNYISHTIDRVSYDEDVKGVVVEISFLDNDKGNHLVNLFTKAPEKIKVCPILSGDIKDGNATSVDLIRVDFHYNFMTYNLEEHQQQHHAV